jgi:hypothetical protein
MNDDELNAEVADQHVKAIAKLLGCEYHQVVAEVEGAKKENINLREQIWLRHGCIPPALYGDDGEMQCSACGVDFRSDPIARILEFWDRKRCERRKELDDYKSLAASATACVETGQKWMESDGKKLETLRVTVNTLADLLLRIHPYARYRLLDLSEELGDCGETSGSNETHALANELDEAVEAIKKGRAG